VAMVRLCFVVLLLVKQIILKFRHGSARQSGQIITVKEYFMFVG
jgi:hypothetical protein